VNLVAKPTAEGLLDAAVAEHRSGRLSVAEPIYRRLIADDRRHIDAWHLLGVLQHQQGRHEDAVASIRQALHCGGRSAAMFSHLGSALREMNRTVEAEQQFRRAIEREPHTAGFHYNLANCLREQGRREEAVESYRQALQLDPESAEAWNNLGNALHDLRRDAEAEEAFRRALSFRPNFADAALNLGNLLRGRERLDEAVACYRQAVQRQPENVNAWINLGYTLEDLRQMDDAVAAYESALQHDPDSPQAHLNRALARLRQEDFQNGWPEYDWRLKKNGEESLFAEVMRMHQLPEQLNSAFVVGEQGIGDQILFASCLPDLIARCRRCRLSCDERLRPMFARSFPTAEIVAAGDCSAADHRSAECLLPLGSLPRLFRPTMEAFPQSTGYLVPHPGLLSEWRRRLAALRPGLVVGISWRGGRDPVVNRRRSTQPADWADLLAVPGVRFVNLQYGSRADELAEFAACSGSAVHDWPDVDPLADLDHFASQIAALDLVISVDNSTVHLAGALGVPTWTLLPRASDWRWFLDREDSPWYASVRLFRQPRKVPASHPAGLWKSVFQRVVQELRLLVSRFAPGDSPGG